MQKLQAEVQRRQEREDRLLQDVEREATSNKVRLSLNRALNRASIEREERLLLDVEREATSNKVAQGRIH
jgi:hypothetical protein